MSDHDQDYTDQPRAIRPGEELDASKLAAFLAQTLPDGRPELQASQDLVIEQFPSGYSNLTYRVQYGGRDMVLRRPPFGANIRSGHDMHREYRVLAALEGIYPHAPRPIVYCDDLEVLGAPFYLMERVVGVVLRPPLPAGLGATPEIMGQIAASVIQNLVAIHALDWSREGLRDLGHPEGYVQRQISGWTERYARARTDDLPGIERMASWLADHQPAGESVHWAHPDSGAALIHNDYRYDNLILDPADLTQIRAVLDWEMATIGDPLMDLGTSLSYWIDPDDPAAVRATAINGSLTTLPGNPDRAGVVQRYAEWSGRDVGDIVFYYVYGIFKLAVIAQQIYARYQRGLTTDERFGLLIHSIRALGQMGERAIELGRISQLG